MFINKSSYCHSTIPSGCSSLESLDSTIPPEAIRLSQLDGSLILHFHNDNTSKGRTESEEDLMKTDGNKNSTKWNGCSQGGEIISKMANVTYVTPTMYYNSTTPSTLLTPSTIATMPQIWVKHKK